MYRPFCKHGGHSERTQVSEGGAQRLGVQPTHRKHLVHNSSCSVADWSRWKPRTWQAYVRSARRRNPHGWLECAYHQAA